MLAAVACRFLLLYRQKILRSFSMLSVHCLHTNALLSTGPCRGRQVKSTKARAGPHGVGVSLRRINTSIPLRNHRVAESRLVVKVKPVDDFVLTPATADMLELDREWISIQIQTWLDEEWTPLDIHKSLGQAAGNAYVTARQNGEEEMTGLLLSVCNQLLAFNYRETFTSAFEVGNKVAELLMLRQGCDVCCTSEDDKQRFERVDEQIAAGSGITQG